MPRVFNSAFENTLRIILLLDAFNTSQNTDILYATDFMVVYGKTFGIANEDLNGDNPYKFSEFVSRRSMVQKALKELVLDGLAIPFEASNGIVYQISSAGKKHCESLDSDYAKEYKMVAERAVRAVDGRSERSVIAQISRMSAESLKETNK